MKVDNKDDLVVDFIFCLAVDILTNFSKGVILKEPNQSNIVTYRTPPRFSRGVLYSFCVLVGMDLIKMQVPSCEHKRVLCATLRYMSVGFGDYRSLRFLGVNFG